MSLKAKIEAVIYASEEPVTLAQLAGLLGNEAQAELERVGSAQGALELGAGDAVDDMAAEAALEDTSWRGDGSGESLSADADGAVGDGSLEEEQGLPAALEGKDERQAAREERARAQRLREYFRGLLAELIAEYANGDRGLEIREVAGGYRLATKPEYHDAVRGFARSLKPPLKLTLQALETLAVVAYKQPVTAPEISEIRGVDSGGVLGSLMARKLIATAGRKPVIGRPILYKTTKDFLLRFGLRDVAELPSIEEFEKLAGELADHDAAGQEEMVMREEPGQDAGRLTTAELEEELGASEPQADSNSLAVDTVPVDGRMSGVDPSYRSNAEMGAESPALDAEVQQDVEEEGASR